MNGWNVGWRRAGWMGLAASTALTAMLALGGCANVGGATSAENTSDNPSQSNESELRRRARIRLELAANYLQMGQNTVALDEVRQSISIDPTYADAHHLRGLILMREGDLPRAEESIRQAQNMRPNDPDILHNMGWLQCQLKQYAQADQLFDRALATPAYRERGRTLMSKGICLDRAGKPEEAEVALLKAYELDVGNPVLGFQLAGLKFRKGDIKRAQFYIRRVNNGEFSNAESLWLGIKIERALGESVSVRQLAEQLRKRFPDAKEALAYERGAFNE